LKWFMSGSLSGFSLPIGAFLRFTTGQLFIMKTTILFIITFLLCTALFGQDPNSFFGNKKRGYIIKKDGTVESGILRFGTFSEIVFFDEHGEKIPYNARDLKEVVIYDAPAHRTADTLYYKTIIYPGFAKGVNVSLLKATYRGKYINTYELVEVFYNAQGLPLSSVSTFINFPDTHIGHPVSGKKFFKKELSKLLEDCPSLVNKIKSKVYKPKDLEKVIIEYDECMSNK